MGRILRYDRMGDVSAAVNHAACEFDWDETVTADVFSKYNHPGTLVEIS